MSTGIKSLDLILVMLFAYSIVLLGMCLIYLSFCTVIWLGNMLYEHNKLAHIVVDFGDNILISIYEYIDCRLTVLCYFLMRFWKRTVVKTVVGVCDLCVERFIKFLDEEDSNDDDDYY